MKNRFHAYKEYDESREFLKDKKGIPEMYLPSSTSKELSYLEGKAIQEELDAEMDKEMEKIKREDAQRKALQQIILKNSKSFPKKGRGPALGSEEDLEVLEERLDEEEY